MSKNLRKLLFEWIFEADTRTGRIFDITLLVAIVLSVMAVLAESVPGWQAGHGSFFIAFEWFFTTLFTIEYILRIYAAPNRLRYIFSFLGLLIFWRYYPPISAFSFMVSGVY
jgi:voltage-gated potassium channel